MAELRWTRRQVVKASLAAGAAASMPGWLSAAQEEASPLVAGRDSLRAHAAAHGLLYGTAVNPNLLEPVQKLR